MASGSLSLAKAAAQMLLGDCPTFRTLCGAATGAEARARIHLDGLPRPANGDSYTLAEHEAARPCAILYTVEDAGFRRRRAAMQAWDESGAIIIRLLRTVPGQAVVDNEPDSQADRDWSDIVGGIIDDLCERAGGSGADGAYLDFEAIALNFGPYCGRREDVIRMGVWQGADLLVEFGLGGA